MYKGFSITPSWTLQTNTWVRSGLYSCLAMYMTHCNPLVMVYSNWWVFLWTLRFGLHLIICWIFLARDLAFFLLSPFNEMKFPPLVSSLIVFQKSPCSIETDDRFFFGINSSFFIQKNRILLGSINTMWFLLTFIVLGENSLGNQWKVSRAQTQLWTYLSAITKLRVIYFQ